MTNKSLIFAGIFAAITTSSFATGENTVTSKSYVDAQDALKQDKITAKTTGNVVTYNGTDANGQAQFSEKGIYDDSNTYNDTNDSEKLITAGTVANMASAIESITIPDNKLTCYNSPDCTLWTISNGTTALTAAGTLAPLTEACKVYNETFVNGQAASQCCSRVSRPCDRGATYCACGCATVTDCPSGSTSCSTLHECL